MQLRIIEQEVAEAPPVQEQIDDQRHEQSGQHQPHGEEEVILLAGHVEPLDEVREDHHRQEHGLAARIWVDLFEIVHYRDAQHHQHHDKREDNAQPGNEEQLAGGPIRPG